MPAKKDPLDIFDKMEIPPERPTPEEIFVGMNLRVGYKPSKAHQRRTIQWNSQGRMDTTVGKVGIVQSFYSRGSSTGGSFTLVVLCFLGTGDEFDEANGWSYDLECLELP